MKSSPFPFRKLHFENAVSFKKKYFLPFLNYQKQTDANRKRKHSRMEEEEEEEQQRSVQLLWFYKTSYSCSHAKNEFYLCHLELPWLHFGGSDTTSRSTLSCLALKYNSSAFKIPNSCLSEFDTGILRGLHENKYVICISNLYAGRRKRLPRRIQKSPQSPVRRQETNGWMAKLSTNKHIPL